MACGGEAGRPSTSTDRAASGSSTSSCSGCHSLESANSYGSKPQGQIKPGERTNGPNFNQRKEQRDDVLFAIRNGGFSGAIMPANIVIGDEAEPLADYLAKYSGRKRDTSAAGSGAGP